MTIEDIFAVTNAMKADIENLSVDDLKSEIAANPDLLLIDIREIQELIDLGTIPAATHCARGMLEFWASPASPSSAATVSTSRATSRTCCPSPRRSRARGPRSVWTAASTFWSACARRTSRATTTSSGRYVPVAPAGAQRRIQVARCGARSVRFITGAVSMATLPDGGGRPEVALVGRSNVGKSSLINSLKRARAVNVGATPGVTTVAQTVAVDANDGMLRRIVRDLLLLEDEFADGSGWAAPFAMLRTARSARTKRGP